LGRFYTTSDFDRE